LAETVKTIYCDGCGRAAAPEHIAQRLARLEMATRFRPIHIGVLFLAAMPPQRVEDYFYNPEAGLAGHDGSPDHNGARMLLEALLARSLRSVQREAGVAAAPPEDREAALGEFQRRGYYLADAVECPVPVQSDGAGQDAEQFRAVLAQLTPTVVKRVHFSYKPKQVVLLSMRLGSLIPALEQGGLGDRLLLDQGGPLELPLEGSAASEAEFRERLAALLQAGASRSRGA